MKKSINAPHAPTPAPFFSHAVITNNLVFTSGQIGLDPSSMQLVSDDVGEQTAQILTNLKSILEAANTNLELVVKVTVYLTNIDDYNDMNKIYAQHFTKNPPARTAVAVKSLPLNAKVEIEMIAEIGMNQSSDF